jgi:hypothetical protein
MESAACLPAPERMIARRATESQKNEYRVARKATNHANAKID